MKHAHRFLKILSYNIHKGFDWNNRRSVLKDIRQSIRDTGADLVFLQEVSGDDGTQRQPVKDHPLSSQFEFLADGVWKHFAYGKNAVYDEGHHGNALLSKYPILSWDNLDISTNRWERRGLLHAVIDHPLAPRLHALSLHLNLLARSRLQQTKKICAYIKQQSEAQEKLVLAGDFNDWREQITQHLDSELQMKEIFLALHGKHAKTFPSFSPLLSLDRIYTRGLRPVKATRLHGEPWSRLSDHLALYAEVEIGPF